MISGLQLGSSSVSSRFKAELKEENHFYMKISKDDFSIQIINKDFVPVPGYNYRIVHNLEAASEPYDSEDLFVDSQFMVDPKQQFPEEEVIVKRLSNLYGLTNLPHFFDLDKKPTYLEDNERAMNCIRQLGLLSTGHYKSLFITQSFQKNGKYVLVASINGRFEVISVDDRIPIYKKTLEPVWGYRYDSPWQLILLKAWAKVRGGYHKVAKARPFQFIQTFSDAIWKYFNLAKESKKFLEHYYENSKFKNGKIVLKTKKDERVVKSGLTADSASYQLVAIHEETVGKDNQQKQRRFVLTIRSTDLAKYSDGELSFYHPSAKHYLTEGLTLDHDMLMTDREFLSLFSSANITSIRHEDFYSGYKILDIEKFERKAQYFEFIVPKDGFFDFSIEQFSQNRLPEGGQWTKKQISDSKSQNSSKNQGGNNNARFLRTKYILVRDTNFQQSSSLKNNNTESSRIKAIRGSELGYPLPRFTTYEIQYFKGYSKGSAHFVKLDAGRYILRFKSQNVEFDAKYAMNWSCSDKVDLVVANLSVEEEIDLLHDSMVSIMHRYPHFSYDKHQKSQMLTIADSFEDIGYGFASIKCSTTCNRSVMVEVDPERLHHEGYRLKGRYKTHGDTFKRFSIKVENGEYDAIVFKKRKDAKQFVWPSESFNIYKKEFKEPRQNTGSINQ